MRTEIDQSHIRQLVQGPQWMTVKGIANELVAEIKKEQSIADTEWMTIRQTLEQSGRIRGVQELVETLERLSSYESET